MLSGKNRLTIKEETKLTKMSRFTAFLVQIFYPPIKTTSHGILSFRICSFECLSAFILYILTFFILQFLNMFFTWKNIPAPEHILEVVNITDWISIFGFGVSNFLLYPFIPIILAKAASAIPEISAVTCLRWPQLSYSMIVCQCISLLGYFLNVVPNFLHFGRTAFLQKNVYCSFDDDLHYLLFLHLPDHRFLMA